MTDLTLTCICELRLLTTTELSVYNDGLYSNTDSRISRTH